MGKFSIILEDIGDEGVVQILAQALPSTPNEESAAADMFRDIIILLQESVDENGFDSTIHSHH